MKTYTINGFIVPVTEKEHKTKEKLFDDILEHVETPKRKEYEQIYNKFVYDLYKNAILNGKAKRVDDHFVIHEDDGIYTYHFITHQPR